MNVYVPWVGSWPKDVLQAIDEGKYVGPVEATELDADDPDDYYLFLANLWFAREPFIIVEHDIIVGEHTLEKMAECAAPWCATGYLYWGGVYYGLGCMKFGAELMEKVPDAMDQVGKLWSDEHPAKHWCAIDARLQVVLTRARFKMCEHAGVLDHRGHNGHSKHGCR